MYKAFISYRRNSPVNADFIHRSIADLSAFTEEEIFLDKHSIGPELFDEKIEHAIEESNCMILLVTKNCFKIINEGEGDWFLKEIRTAISHGKRIIPVLFDRIESLGEAEIVTELNKYFDEEEVETLVKSQSVLYCAEYPEASIRKLINFLDEINTATSVGAKVLTVIKGIGIGLVSFITFFVFCFGLGFLWGYVSTSTKIESVLADNTVLSKEGVLSFEFEGWKATYNLITDKISIDDIDKFDNKPRIGNADLLLSTFTIHGTKLLLEKNFAYLKYLKFLRGSSKQSRIAYLCASALACIGAFCGFSQGCRFGKTKHQQDIALKLYPELKHRSTWEPLLNGKYRFSYLFTHRELGSVSNALTFGSPIDTTAIAFRAGLSYSMVLLKYNDWEIEKNDYNDLTEVIAESRDAEKVAVFLNMKDSSVSEYHLPSGVVGILFQLGDSDDERYEIAVAKFKEWKGRINEHLVEP